MTITILDGGMGQELIRRAKGSPTPLWSTQVMLDEPGLVADVHRDFAQAGADIATTNTYAIHHDRLAGTPYQDRFAELYKMALDEVKTAGAGRIAGSIGPLSASYRPDLHPQADVAVPMYREIAGLLAPHCNLLICETVASVLHAQCVLDACDGFGLPVWLAVTVDDKDGTRLRSGEALSGVLDVARAKASAILINCSTPEVIPDALDVLSGAGLPFGAYANGFERITEGFLEDKPTVDALRARNDLTPDAYADHAALWIGKGATIVGGCCEVGPDHIAALKRRFGAPAA